MTWGSLSTRRMRPVPLVVGLGLRGDVSASRSMPIGKVTVKVVPSPGRLSTRISPPCRFTIE